MSMREDLEQANVRVTVILHLDSMCPDGELSSELRDHLLWDEGPPTALGFGMLADTMSAEDYEAWLEDGFMEWLVDHPDMWVVKVASPVRTYRKDGSNNYGFSWGHCRTKWFVGKTYIAAVMDGLMWAEKMGEREKEKANA
jgi:hypothetical protein